MNLITVKFPNDIELKAIYAEEAIVEDGKRRLTLRLSQSENYDVKSISQVCTENDISSIIVTNGDVSKTIEGMNKVENIAWRISEYDKNGDLTVVLSNDG